MNEPTSEVRRLPRYLAVAVATVVVVGVVGVVGWWFACWFTPVTTVLLVRHADRDGDNDALTGLGETRAAVLAHVAGPAGIDAVFTSDTNRSRRTAQDLAGSLGLAPVEVAGGDPAATADAILALHRGETVLVVGHSNTVPDIIEELGGGALPDVHHDVYDNLFVLTRCGRCPTKVVNLKYGAVTLPAVP